MDGHWTYVRTLAYHCTVYVRVRIENGVVKLDFILSIFDTVQLDLSPCDATVRMKHDPLCVYLSVCLRGSPKIIKNLFHFVLNAFKSVNGEIEYKSIDRFSASNVSTI